MLSVQAIDLSVLILFAFVSNVFLGYFREACRKYSLSWFTLIHLSIPFIILLRCYFGFDWRCIPLTIGFAVAGQLTGGRLRKKRLT